MCIVEKLQRHVDMDDMELVGIVARNLWLRHDTIMVHGKLVSPYSTVISNAYDTLVSFHNVNSCKYPLKLAGNLELCWHAPPDDFVKVNKKNLASHWIACDS